MNPGEAFSGSIVMPLRGNGCWEEYLSEAGVKDSMLSKAFEQSVKKPIVYVLSSSSTCAASEQV